LLVGSNFGRCLVTNEAVRPGQESKWPRWMAPRKVEGSGLKAQACRKAARSCFVERCRMAPFAAWRRGLGDAGTRGGDNAAFGARGIVHSPFAGSRWPTMMTWPFL
jgi:hypothetical protein